MTTENTLIGPDEPGDGINWALLDQQVFGDVAVDEPQPAPAPAASVPAVRESEDASVPAEEVVVLDALDEDDDDVDPDADAFLWPVVVDGRGRPTSEVAQPNPEAMRTALRRARETSAADVEVLAEAISEPETRQIILLASEQRAYERQLDSQVTKRRTELASEGARRQAEHEAKLAEARRRRENRAVAALERRDRALDPTSRIVRLAAAERIIPWIAVLPAALAAVLGAINVGLCLDELSPNTQVINWLVEPLLTIPVIAILVAQILGAIGEGRNNPYRNLEWALVTVALGLNVGLHVAVDGLTPAAAVWAIVPAGLAISAHLVPKLIQVVRQALQDASDVSAASPRGPQSGPQTDADHTLRLAPAQPESTRTVPGPSQVSEESTPESRSDEELVAELVEAVRDGRIDPQTGRAMNPHSAESIRRTLGVGKANSRVLRDFYKSNVAAE